MRPSASRSRKSSWESCAAPVPRPPRRRPGNVRESPGILRGMRIFGRVRVTSFIASLGLGAALLLPAHAQAPAAPSASVYTVEMIVFRNTSGAGGPEDWNSKPVARRPDTPDSPVTGRFVQSIPAAQFQLNDVAAKLRNTANYQPIAHFAWQQTASSWGS